MKKWTSVTSFASVVISQRFWILAGLSWSCIFIAVFSRCMENRGSLDRMHRKIWKAFHHQISHADVLPRKSCYDRFWMRDKTADSRLEKDHRFWKRDKTKVSDDGTTQPICKNTGRQFFRSWLKLKLFKIIFINKIGIKIKNYNN